LETSERIYSVQELSKASAVAQTVLTI